MVGYTLVTTDCISASDSKGVVPNLPIELLEMVVKYVVDDMRRSRNGATVRALMHTSLFFRFTCAKAFAPVYLERRHSSRPSPYKEELCVPDDLSAYIWSTIQDTLLTDFSVRRSGGLAPSRPQSTECLKTASGTLGEAVKCKIEFKSDKVMLADGRLARNFPAPLAQSRVVTPQSGTVRIKHACKAVEELMHRGDFMLRSVSPFARALRGSTDVSNGGGATFYVRLKLQVKDVHINQGPQMQWRCVTKAAFKPGA